MLLGRQATNNKQTDITHHPPPTAVLNVVNDVVRQRSVVEGVGSLAGDLLQCGGQLGPSDDVASWEHLSVVIEQKAGDKAYRNRDSPFEKFSLCGRNNA